LGDETAKLLVTEGLVRQLPDLFDLTSERLVTLEGFAEKSAENLVDGLAKASRAELHRFLIGLGIPEVGVAVAKDLARHFRSLDALRRASGEDLETVPGVGPKMAEQIGDFFRDERNREMLDTLLAKVALVEPTGATAAQLAGLKVVFTGGLTQLSRRDAKQLVESLGGRVTSSVSKETTFVVVGENPGSKFGDAQRLGVQTLTEEEFVEFVRSKGGDV
jgi:DNA ligase (NAD+)